MIGLIAIGLWLALLLAPIWLALLLLAWAKHDYTRAVEYGRATQPDYTFEVSIELPEGIDPDDVGVTVEVPAR